MSEDAGSVKRIEAEEKQKIKGEEREPRLTKSREMLAPLLPMLEALKEVSGRKTSGDKFDFRVVRLGSGEEAIVTNIKGGRKKVKKTFDLDGKIERDKLYKQGFTYEDGSGLSLLKNLAGGREHDVVIIPVIDDYIKKPLFMVCECNLEKERDEELKKSVVNSYSTRSEGLLGDVTRIDKKSMGGEPHPLERVIEVITKMAIDREMIPLETSGQKSFTRHASRGGSQGRDGLG